MSEGHHHPEAVRELLTRGFERVVGSVHSLPDLENPGQRVEASSAYLAEAAEMAASDAPFRILGHLDYALRHWPDAVGSGAVSVAVQACVFRAADDPTELWQQT